MEYTILKMINRARLLELDFKNLFLDMDTDKNGYLSVSELIGGVR